MDPYHLVPLGKKQSVLPSGQLVRLTIIHIINVFGNIIIYSTDNNYHPDNMIIWMVAIIRTTFFPLYNLYNLYNLYIWIYMDLYGSIMIQIYGQLQLLCQPTQHGQQNHKGGSSSVQKSMFFLLYETSNKAQSFGAKFQQITTVGLQKPSLFLIQQIAVLDWKKMCLVLLKNHRTSDVFHGRNRMFYWQNPKKHRNFCQQNHRCFLFSPHFLTCSQHFSDISTHVPTIFLDLPSMFHEKKSTLSSPRCSPGSAWRSPTVAPERPGRPMHLVLS